MKVRSTVKTWQGELNSFNLHGNRSYDELQNWIGQDIITTSSDKRIAAPINGYLSGGYDPNGGYYCTIEGEGDYANMFILMVHMNDRCAEGYVTKGNLIGREGPQAHIHIGVMWGDGTWQTGNTSLPYTGLLENSDSLIGSYTAGDYVEGFCPPESELERFVISH